MNNLISELESAITGLLYQSENDFPLKVVCFEKPPQGESSDFDNFFLAATQEQDWHGEDEKESVRRYKALVKLLTDNLTELQVIEVDNVEKDVYVVGKASDGRFVGISTKVVET